MIDCRRIRPDMICLSMLLLGLGSCSSSRGRIIVRKDDPASLAGIERVRVRIDARAYRPGFPPMGSDPSVVETVRGGLTRGRYRFVLSAANPVLADNEHPLESHRCISDPPVDFPTLERGEAFMEVRTSSSYSLKFRDPETGFEFGFADAFAQVRVWVDGNSAPIFERCLRTNDSRESAPLVRAALRDIPRRETFAPRASPNEH